MYLGAREDRAPSPSDTEELKAGKSTGKKGYYHGLAVRGCWEKQYSRWLRKHNSVSNIPCSSNKATNVLVRQDKLTVFFNIRSVPPAGHGIIVTQDWVSLDGKPLFPRLVMASHTLAFFPYQVWLHRKDYECGTMGERARGNTSVYFCGLAANTPFYPHTLDDENLSWLMLNLICLTSPTQRTSSPWESLGQKTQGTSQIWSNKKTPKYSPEEGNQCTTLNTHTSAISKEYWAWATQRTCTATPCFQVPTEWGQVVNFHKLRSAIHCSLKLLFLGQP